MLYHDRLVEGRIVPEMYDRKAAVLGNQATALTRRIEEIRGSKPASVTAAIDVMDTISRTAGLFSIQPVAEKQAFLHLVVKSATWKHGELRTQFESPFENLAV